MSEVYLTGHYAAAPEKVFDFFLDHNQFARIWPGETKRIKDAPGDNPNDVGSVRSIKVGISTIEEEQITAERPVDGKPGLIEYKVIRGGAITDHKGHIEFHPAADGGTDIKYTIMLKMAVPGLAWLVLRNIKGQWLTGSKAIAADLS